MKKYLFLIVLFYANFLLAQQISELKLFRNNANYYLLNEKDTIAFINQLPKDGAFFNGKLAIASKGKDFSFLKVNKEMDLKLNYTNRTFIYNGNDYNFVIDYLQNNLVLFSGSKVILKIEGRNLKRGIAIHYYNGQPNVQLAYLAFMIKRDAKTKFIIRHSVYKIGSFAAVAFSAYSLFYLVK